MDLLTLPDGYSISFAEDSPGAETGTVTLYRSDPANNIIRAFKVAVSGNVSAMTFTAELDVTTDPDAFEVFEKNGLIGLKPGASAALESVRFVVRAIDDRNGYTSEHPCVAIFLDWGVSAWTQDEIGEVQGETAIKTTVTTGFSSIFPLVSDEFGRGLQVRIDGIGLSTGWVSLNGLFDAVDYLLAWFESFDIAQPEFDAPSWEGEFRLNISLPLGLSFRETYLILNKSAQGGYLVNFGARGLIVKWDGVKLFEHEDAEISLLWVAGVGPNPGRYEITAKLWRATYPKKGTGKDDPVRPATLSLPFGALKLEAQAWHISVGFFASDADKQVCPEIILEIFKPRLTSSLAEKGPLWEAKALRLNMLGTSVLTCDAPEGGITFFDGVEGTWFDAVQQLSLESYTQVVLKDGEPPESEESPAISFVDGEFDPARLFLHWKQSNGALLDKLRTLIPGLKKAEGASPSPQMTAVAFELATFEHSEGKDQQIRLEWRDESAPEPAAENGEFEPVADFEPAADVADAILAQDEGCVGVHENAVTLSLPENNHTTVGRVEDAALHLSLPVVDVAIAEPDAKSLLYFKPANAQPTMSLLHIYEYPTAGENPEDRVVAHAALDFSMIGGDESEGENRQSLPSKSGREEEDDDTKPLIEFAISPRAKRSAIAVGSWTQGQQPKIMRAYRGGAEPFDPLLPPPPAPLADGEEQEDRDGAEVASCRHCPAPPAATPAPARLDPSLFGTPAFGQPSSQWQLVMQLAAQKRMLDLFDSKEGGNPLSFEIEKICWDKPQTSDAFLPPLLIHARLTIDPSGLIPDPGGEEETKEKIEGTAIFRFDPSDMSLRMVEGGTFAVKRAQEAGPPSWWQTAKIKGDVSKIHFAKPISMLGLNIQLVSPQEEEVTDRNAPFEFLRLDMRDGRFVLALAAGTQAYVQVAGLRTNGANSNQTDDKKQSTLVFRASHFQFGSGGLDLDAQLAAGQLKLPGLASKFALDTASLSVVGNRMRDLRLSAMGKMPEILDSAPVRVTIDLKQDNPGGQIDIAGMSAELTEGRKIESDSKRYIFVIRALSLVYKEQANGDRQFYFTASGSATFAPKKGEFQNALLANLKSVSLEFDSAPISDEFVEGIAVVVELRKPKTFDLFKIFQMEIRSFGFTPKYKFDSGEEKAALILGGQAKFAETGDVISGQIDFHRLYIGRAAEGQPLPEVSARGLKVAISAADGFEIGGSLDTYDDNNQKGFKGSGFVEIPGMPRLSAALGFIELRNRDGEWKKSWFIAIDMSGISCQIPPLPIYLRQIGLGFGYRQTHILVKTAEQELPIGELLRRMMAEIDNYHSLTQPESWVNDLEEPGKSPRWTIGLEAAFSLGSPQADLLDYDAENERKYRTAILQVLAAIRSDLSLVAAAKLWLPVSFDDFHRNAHNMRARPLARGFMHYSPRQQRLLVHASKGKGDIYYGPTKDKRDRNQTEFAKQILDPVPFDVTALVEPGRLRVELGWVDRLVFPFRLGPLKLECRGGMLMALEDDAVITGLYFSARGQLGFSARAGGRSLGMSASAVAKIHFAARILTVKKIVRPLDSHAYGEIGIDINVKISVKAWMRFKAGFVKIKLSIRFSISIQVVVALQVGWAGQADLGFRGRATIVVRAFGRRLRAKVHVGYNENSINRARRLVSPYLDSIVEPGKIPPMPGVDGKSLQKSNSQILPSEQIIEQDGSPRGLARADNAGAQVNALRAGEALAGDGAQTDEETAEVTFAEEFVFVALPAVGKTDGKKWRLVWIMPTTTGGLFYPVPEKDAAEVPAYAKVSGLGANVHMLDKDRNWTAASGGEAELFFRNASYQMEDEGGGEQQGAALNLRKMLAGCYKPTDQLEREQRADFPFNFTADVSPTASPEQRLIEFVSDGLAGDDVREDDRLRDGQRKDDPRLHKGNAFDDALEAAIAADKDGNDALEDAAEEAALANQSLLLRGFQSDLEELAEKMADWTDLQALEAGDEPTVFDLGTVLLVEEEDDSFPAWLDKRKLDRSEEEEDRPKIQFAGHTTAHPLRPVVDADAVSFAGNNIGLVDQPIVHFDDETLAVHWKMDWTGDGGPKVLQNGEPGNVAKGNGTAFEDYLKCYRVEIHDLSGGRGTLGTREVVPANLLVPADGTNSQVQLAPRYALTIPVDELLGNDRTLGQRTHRLELRVTPINQWDEEGESFVIIAEQEPRATPLPADQPQLLLESLKRPGEEKPQRMITLRWIEPALPNQAGVAATDGWEIIFRPLSKLPFGAYPAEVDAVDEGVSGSAQSSTLRPGDLILRLTPKLPSQHDTDGSERFEISLTPALTCASKWKVHAGSATPLRNLTWALHQGEGLHEIRDDNPSDRLEELMAAVQEGKPAIDAKGEAWQIFVRARSDTPVQNNGKDKPARAQVSSMGRFSMFAHTEKGAKRDEWDKIATQWQPLPHFEWPSSPTEEFSLPRPLVDIGVRHIPVIDQTREPAENQTIPSLNFVVPKEGTRIMQIEWSGFAEQGQHAIEALTGFSIHEAVLDGATSIDTLELKNVTSFRSADPAGSGDNPADLSAPQNWQVWGARKVLALLDRKVPSNEDEWLLGRKPGALWWPSEPDNLTNNEQGDTDTDTDTDTLEDTEAYIPQGPANLNATLRQILEILGKAAKAQGYALELGYGYPERSYPTPQQWMEGNDPARDPNGWAALWHLGLAVEIAMRDPLTGLRVDQAELLEQIYAACGKVEADPDLRHLAIDLPVRPQEVATTGKSNDTGLDETGLNRAILMMRPLVYKYCPPASTPDALHKEETERFWSLLRAAPLAGEEPERPEKMPEAVQLLYKQWSDRFFEVATRVTKDEARKDVPPLREICATAIPDTDTLAELSPDQHGQFSYSRVIDGELASTREIAIGADWRYAALLKSMDAAIRTEDETAPAAEDKTASIKPSAKTLVQIDRVRKPAPPELLKQDIFLKGGMYFHRLAFAEHPEARLSNDNDLARQRLQYRGSRSSFRRSFMHNEWLKLLNKVEGGPDFDATLPKSAVTVIERDIPTIETDDDAYLAITPDIRQGARIVTIPCEAHYYRTDASFQTLARHVSSSIEDRQLVSMQPGPCEPMDPDDEPAIAPGPLALRIAELRKAATETGDCPEALFTQVRQLAIRLPRFAESLADKQMQANETGAEFVGNLPDCTVSTQAVHTLDGSAQAMFAVKARKEGGALTELAQAFELVAASPDYDASDFIVSVKCGHTWADGLNASVTIRHVATAPLAIEGIALPSVVIVPGAGPDLPAELVKHEKFPAKGALCWLAPLLARLDLTEDAIRLERGPIGSDRMLRPLSLDVNNPEDGNGLATDLGNALRLLLNTERFAAAKVYAWHESPDKDLARAIEEADFALWRKPSLAKLQEKWLEIKDLDLWQFDGDGSWIELTEPPEDGEAPHVIAIGTETQTAEVAAFQALTDDFSEHRTPMAPDAILALGTACGEAGATLAPTATDQAEWSEETVSVHVQRGNEPRTIWPVRSLSNGS